MCVTMFIMKSMKKGKRTSGNRISRKVAKPAKKSRCSSWIGRRLYDFMVNLFHCFFSLHSALRARAVNGLMLATLRVAYRELRFWNRSRIGHEDGNAAMSAFLRGRHVLDRPRVWDDALVVLLQCEDEAPSSQRDS